MIRKITDAMVEIEGEAMRGVTWVRVLEVASGNWGIGGKGLLLPTSKPSRPTESKSQTDGSKAADRRLGP